MRSKPSYVLFLGRRTTLRSSPPPLGNNTCSRYFSAAQRRFTSPDEFNGGSSMRSAVKRLCTSLRVCRKPPLLRFLRLGFLPPPRSRGLLAKSGALGRRKLVHAGLAALNTHLAHYAVNSNFFHFHMLEAFLVNVYSFARAFPRRCTTVLAAACHGRRSVALRHRALSHEIIPFLTAYKINSARLCRFSFSCKFRRCVSTV